MSARVATKPFESATGAGEIEQFKKDVGVDEDLEETMKHTCWCWYCLFEGCGVAKPCNPIVFGGRQKFLCCESYWGTTGCWTDEEGCCMGVQKTGCLIETFSFPPGGSKNDGIPCCALCNVRCGGEEEDDTPSVQKTILDESFLLYQFLCCGCGVASCSPFILGRGKTLCCHGGNHTAGCNDTEHGCCYTQQKTLCCVEASACPPGGGSHDGIPCCALLGQQCGGEDPDYIDEDELYDVPMHQPMQSQMY